jgi:hypothetical protein
MITTPWTSQEDAILRERFASCSSIEEVVPYLPGRTYNAIRTRANAYLGVKIKKLPVHDTHCFDVPDEINCSWAGYLAADGCVSDKGRLTLGIASKDRAHIEALVLYMGFTGRIWDYTKSYTDLKVKKYGKVSTYSGTCHISTLQIQCPAVCVQLARHWNITPRKTRTLQPPNLTDDRLIMAYLSGFIDGDGWIIEDKSTKHPQYSIAVMGTKEMMEWTKAVFDRLTPYLITAKLQPTESDNIYDYKVSGVKAFWLAKLFLTLDIPRLDRKWDKMRRLIAEVEAGTPSQRFLTTMVNGRPSDTILTQFGLLDYANALCTTVRPSVA